MYQRSQMLCQARMMPKTEKGGWHLSSEGASHLFRLSSAHGASGVLQAVRADGGNAAAGRLNGLERDH